MVNPALMLAAVGGQLGKRDSSSLWTSAVSTSYELASQATTVTLLGDYTTTQAVSGSAIIVSTKYWTTGITASYATSPLISPSSPDAYCSTQYSAYSNDLYYIDGSAPTFMVGFTTPCLPTGYQTVDYYSPGICPSGYGVSNLRSFETTVSKSKATETEIVCCFTSFKLIRPSYGNWYCTTEFNPDPETTGPLSATSTALVTQWTVTAQYASITASKSTFSTAVVVSGSMITTVPRTSTTYVGTSSHLFSIVTGGYGAVVRAPIIALRFQSTDQFAVTWFNSQTIDGVAHPSNASTPSSTPPPTPHKSRISGGAIAGIAIGGLVVLGLLIGGLVFCLRRRRRNAQSELPAHQDMAKHVYIQPKGYGPDISGQPPMSPATDKSELDSRPLSTEQYSAYHKASPSNSPYQGVQSQSLMPPTISELPVNSASQSIAGNTLHESSRSPIPEWDNQRPQSHDSSSVPETDTHASGLLISAPGPETVSGAGSVSTQPARSTWLEQQQRQVKEEKARLTRLQELSEMEARLEEQLQRELAEERR